MLSGYTQNQGNNILYYGKEGVVDNMLNYLYTRLLSHYIFLYSAFFLPETVSSTILMIGNLTTHSNVYLEKMKFVPHAWAPEQCTYYDPD